MRVSWCHDTRSIICTVEGVILLERAGPRSQMVELGIYGIYSTARILSGGGFFLFLYGGS